jgi:hypothetical protein
MTADWTDKSNLAEFYEGMETWTKITLKSECHCLHIGTSIAGKRAQFVEYPVQG